MDITKPLSDIDVALLKPKFHEALDMLYEVFSNQESTKVCVLLMTFEIPRKSYEKSLEWFSVCNVWRSGLLDVGDSGSDEHGGWQVHKLNDAGREFMKRHAAPAADGGRGTFYRFDGDAKTQ